MSETNNQNNIIVFLDTIGRTLVGERLSETDETILIKNPVILNVVPSDGGKMSVQLFPLFFREFLADKTESISFHFRKKSISLSDISALDFRLLAQYSQMFNNANLFVPEESAPSKSVVNLFEE
jgi:hypothetical protein